MEKIAADIKFVLSATPEEQEGILLENVSGGSKATDITGFSMGVAGFAGMTACRIASIVYNVKYKKLMRKLKTQDSDGGRTVSDSDLKKAEKYKKLSRNLQDASMVGAGLVTTGGLIGFFGRNR